MMQTPSSSGRPRLSSGSIPLSWPRNYTTTTEYSSRMLATGHEAHTRPVHDGIPIPNPPPVGIPAFGNSYSPNTSLFGGPQGELHRPPRQELADNAALDQSELETQSTKPQGKLLAHAKVVHTPENYARILRLSKREQAIVFTDGGNSVESQLLVLDTIEQYPPDNNNKRVWTEVPALLPSGKETIEYHCKARGCDYRDQKFQKARQHFVSSHVAEACWGCPIEGCSHSGKYKRLDDLKHHHMVSAHGIEYTRNRKRDAPESTTVSSVAGQAPPHPTTLTSPLTDGQAPIVDIGSNSSQLLDQGSAALHVLSQAERVPKKGRVARLNVSGGPSQVVRRRVGGTRVTSTNTSGHGKAIPAEASPLDMSHHANTLGLANPPPVFTDALSSHGNSYQTSPWSNYTGSPSHLGTTPAENVSPLDAFDFTYLQAPNTPLDSSHDTTSVYVPQAHAYSGLSMRDVPQQADYGNVSMSYMPSSLRPQSDPLGTTLTHRTPTLSPQGAVDVSSHLLGQVTHNARMSNRGRSHNQADYVRNDPLFGAGLNLTSPGAQSLTPSPHHSQWEQNYSYNPSHPLLSPTNMSPTQSSSGYTTSSQPLSHTLGALSSDRSNGRRQVSPSTPYAQAQRVAGPTHGFTENGGYLSAPAFSSSHGVGAPSPTQGTIHQDRFGRQTPRESMMMYQAASFNTFETPNPNFGWSPQSESPHPTLSSDPQSNISPNLFLQSTSTWLPNQISENTMHFYP